MAVYTGVTVNPLISFQGYGTTEAGPAGFVVAGTGTYTGVAPIVLTGIPDLLTFPGGFTQTFIATIVLGVAGAFTWTTLDANLGSTGLAVGPETVQVSTFGGNSVTTSAVNFDFACFVAGTMIATPRGEVVVEAVAVGDMVLTADGQSHALTWKGHWVARPDDAADRAVRILSGAFGLGRPLPDLVRSPKHGIWLGDVRVLREPARQLNYHDIALAHHAVPLADGKPAESFCPLGSVPVYADMPEVADPLRRLEVGDAPRLLRQKLGLVELRERAGQLRGRVERVVLDQDGLLVEGWASERGHPVTLRVIVGDRQQAVPANGWRTDLDRAGIPVGAVRAWFPMADGALLRVERGRDGASLPDGNGERHCADISRMVPLSGRRDEAVNGQPGVVQQSWHWGVNRGQRVTPSNSWASISYRVDRHRRPSPSHAQQRGSDQTTRSLDPRGGGGARPQKGKHVWKIPDFVNHFDEPVEHLAQGYTPWH
jgi:hypothetical protein